MPRAKNPSPHPVVALRLKEGVKAGVTELAARANMAPAEWMERVIERAVQAGGLDVAVSSGEARASRRMLMETKKRVAEALWDIAQELEEG